MTLLSFIVLVLSLQIHSSTVACPPVKVVSPCSCCPEDSLLSDGRSSRITCENDELKTTLKRISGYRNPSVKTGENDDDENYRHFFRLTISNSLIEELDSNLIANLTFNFIKIDGCSKLKKIHWLAFKNSAEEIEYVYLQNLPELSALLPAPHNLFDMLNSFINVEMISITSVNIISIPDEAFKSLPKLIGLYITDVNSKYHFTIGDRAFYNLANLDSLSIENYSIDHLPSNAFQFRNDSYKLCCFTLNFDNNTLNSFSFSSGWLNNIDRPTAIYLENQNITFLEQSEFQPFLENQIKDRKSVILGLKGNPFDCSDPRNEWLGKGCNYLVQWNVSVGIFDYCNQTTNESVFKTRTLDHCNKDVDAKDFESRAFLNAWIFTVFIGLTFFVK